MGMPYSAEISRRNPTCFLFLIDQSGSMAEPISGGLGARRKADVVADAVNRLLQALIRRCSKGEGIHDFFQIGVLGYSSTCSLALRGALEGKDLVAVNELADHPLRVEERSQRVDDGIGGYFQQSVKFRVWFDSVAEGKTAMCSALYQAHQSIAEFIRQHPNCFPPIILNLTDGNASDGDPEPRAAALRRLGSTDGNVLLFNLHVSNTQATPLQFPDEQTPLPDPFAQVLFRMSSILPPRIIDYARQTDFPTISPQARGFVFNADIVSIVQFLDIGTRIG